MANHVKVADFLKAVERMPPREIEEVFQRVSRIRSNQGPIGNPASEADLLAKINRGFSEAWWDHYQTLLEKRSQEALTSTEQHELLRLTNVLEKREASRLKVLVRLANLRGCALPKLMKDLGLAGRSHQRRTSA